MTQKLSIHETTIAYAQLSGKGPGILFLHGFRSDMYGSKATALQEWCQKTGRALTRFDYRGHGQSGGNFTDLTLSDWIEDALAVLDQLTQGPQVIVGSSMGGWIMLNLALRRPERVAGLVGLAAAPDFTHDLMEKSLSPEQRQVMEREGLVHCPCDYGDPYPITRRLLDDGEKNQVLGKPLPFHFPVRLIQGMQDTDVPWQTALRLVDAIQGQDVRLTLLKDGDHRLSREQDLALLINTIETQWPAP